MLTGNLFIICGLSRLSARVARALEAANARVTIIVYDGDKASLRAILPPSSTVLTATAENAAATLREAKIDEAACLLALSEDDIANLRSTVSARSINPDVAVVMRAFDPLLADQFEKGFGVRRAFSVSALAAPAFVAAAAGGEMLGSLRLGNDVVPICRLVIRKDSPLIGKTIAEIERDHDVTVIAASKSGADWASIDQTKQDAPYHGSEASFGVRRAFGVGSVRHEASPDHFKIGDEILFSGTPNKALVLLIHAAGWYRRQAQQKENFGRGSTGPKRRRPATVARRRLTWLPRLLALLIGIAVISVFIFARALHLSLVDAIYFVISTMTTVGDNDVDLRASPDWVKLLHCVLMLNGGALLGVSFSYLASIATAERLEVTMARQAARMKGHVVVVGLGNVGYRVTQALTDLGIDMAIIDLAPPARFRDVLMQRAPVLVGDARLSDNLDRVAIRDAEAIIACTSDDVANIETCLHAKRLNPKIRTIARVFDNQIVETAAKAFAIDAVLSATSIAESSFVIAASDVFSIRTIEVPGLSFAAARYRASTRIVAADVRAWKNAGIYLLAFRSEAGAVTSRLTEANTFETIACGPAKTIQILLDNRLNRSG